MILLGKIVGFALILFGIVSALSQIPTYRAFKSEETKFFLTPKNSGSATEIDEADLPEESVQVNDSIFIKTFILPSVLMLVLGIVIVTIALKLGVPDATPTRDKG